VTRVSHLSCVDERDRPVPCDTFGNNVAFACPRCGHPMLAIAREHQRGSSPDNPARCRKCKYECWVEADRVRVRIFSRTL
jgi:hypothetical protein